MATATEYAWLAGIIDGEGCIQASMRARGFYGGLWVQMLHKPTLDRVREIAGGVGCMNVTKRNRPDGSEDRPCWHWAVSTHRAAKVLRHVIPYMVTKRKQAELFVELMDLRAAMSDRPTSDGRQSSGMPKGTKRGTTKFDMAREQHETAIRAIRADKEVSFGKP